MPILADDFIQYFGMLMANAAAMVGVKDLSHRYIFANTELEAFLGAPHGALIGTTSSAWLKPDDAREMQARDAEVVQSGKGLQSIEHFSLGGKDVACATMRFPFRDNTGKIIGAGYIAFDNRDVEKEKSQLEQALEAAQKTIGALQKSVEDIKTQATTDPLTGVWNRSHIEESAHNEIARLERYGHPVSLIFIDIDHFKRVNDTWGHAAGDEVLEGFCDQMRSCMRATDALGRWGGEEFIMLLPNTGRMSASLVAERARSALENHVFPHAGHVTASFGVATCQEGETLSQWMARADAMLYRAKMNGRNRVEVDLESASDIHESITPGFVALVWRSAYECGDPTIDRQHRALFEISNQLLGAVLGCQPKDEIMRMIDVLLAEVVQHFSDEEVIFTAAGFPEAGDHHAIHQQLVASGVDLAKRYAEDKVEVGELFAFLAHEVVAKHMLRDDRKFFPYVSSER